MARGALPAPSFVEYLGQLLLVHRALESALDAAAADEPAIAAVFRGEHHHAPRLEDDLIAHGGDEDELIAATATAVVIQTIERVQTERPRALLGLLYVLEGSMNGNRFIARKLAAAYGLENGRGLRYFDPYGDEQRAVWMRFKADMDALELSVDDRDAIVDAACTMFDGISGISEELSAVASV
jgi:heme oxygenase